MVPERTSQSVTTPWTLVTAIAVIAFSNVMTNRLLPSWAYVPWSAAMAALLLVIAAYDGCTPDDVGLGRSAFWRGVAHGAAVLAAIVAVYLIALAVPATRDLFDDDRVGHVAFLGMAYQVFVRIPLGTVLLEEVAFRGVLLGMLLRRTTVWRAVFGSSALFGLWHVLPAIGIETTNPVLHRLFGDGLGSVVAVIAAVVGTGAAGYVFCWLRLRSRSLVAPMFLHVATNSAGFFVAWWYVRLR